jgi:hypothetical protein
MLMTDALEERKRVAMKLLEYLDVVDETKLTGSRTQSKLAKRNQLERELIQWSRAILNTPVDSIVMLEGGAA